MSCVRIIPLAYWLCIVIASKLLLSLSRWLKFDCIRLELIWEKPKRVQVYKIHGVHIRFPFNPLIRSFPCHLRSFALKLSLCSHYFFTCYRYDVHNKLLYLLLKQYFLVANSLLITLCYIMTWWNGTSKFKPCSNIHD